MDEQSRYRDPPFTVDAVLEHDGQIALIKRGRDPFNGMYALPGGHVDPGEAPEDAVIREVYEETGAQADIVDELGDYSADITDPRYEPDAYEHRAYHCTTDDDTLEGGDDASHAEWVDIADLPDSLAFNHETIINDYRS